MFNYTMKSWCWFIFVFVCAVDCINNLADIECGTLNRKGKIVGGNDAAEGEFPWLVSITRRGGHFCGGSLINKKFVLTAAHCLCSGSTHLKPQSIKITIGQHDLTLPEAPTSYEVSINAIFVHPDYSCDKAANDVALLELSTNVEWSERVKPACLPAGIDEDGYDRFEEKLATVAGWGWMNEDSHKGGRANKLQKAQVNVVETKKCQQWYKSQGKKTKITETQMCAGFEQGGVDSCWADSGGPLMASNSQNTVVIGVVSTGIGCARPKLPGLYTRVSDFIPWIKSIVNK